MRRFDLACLAALLALFSSQFVWVTPTNFKGYDEWLILSLTSRGIVTFPYANRPLALIWNLPGAWLNPHSLAGHFAWHAAYLALGGLVLYLLCRRLTPNSRAFPFLAAAITLVFVPTDPRRLQNIQMTPYSGCTLATLLALLLFIESWRKNRFNLLAPAAGLAFIAVRSYEATFPILVGVAALLLLLDSPSRDRRFWTWAAAWEGAMALLAIPLVMPFLGTPSAVGYQMEKLGFDATPSSMALRMLALYGYHLTPLVDVTLRELWVAAVPPALVALGVPFALLSARDGAALPRQRYLALAFLGLAWAGLAYAPFSLSEEASKLPDRTQFLAAPGIGTALAAGICGLGSFFASRLQRLSLITALALWVVAVGTGRTIAMQRVWDEASAFKAQSATLRQLVRIAPALAPHTLVVLIDRHQAWKETFSFDHGVRYVYGAETGGLLWAGGQLLYDITVSGEGARFTPAPILQGAWKMRAGTYRCDEMLVLRRNPQGDVFLLDAWPPGFPPLAPDATYAPRQRIVDGPRPEACALIGCAEGDARPASPAAR